MPILLALAFVPPLTISTDLPPVRLSSRSQDRSSLPIDRKFYSSDLKS